MKKERLDIAIAIILNHSKVLVGWRSGQQHQGNKDEFPGGKVEGLETAEQACKREILEEVGIQLSHIAHMQTIEHEYDDALLTLHFFYSALNDEYLNSISLPWQWVERDALNTLVFPKANDSILQRLTWPRFIKINHELPKVASDLNQQMHLAEENNAYLIYWRPSFDATMLTESDIEQLRQTPLKNLIVNLDYFLQLPVELQQQINTIHLRQSQLVHLSSSQRRASIFNAKRYIVACHDEACLAHAQLLGADAAFLSPIQATQTHPEVIPMGWDQAKQTLKKCHIPVFALGGLNPSDLTHAIENGFYGVSGIGKFKDI